MWSRPTDPEPKPQLRLGAKTTTALIIGCFTIFALIGVIIFSSPIWWPVVAFTLLGLYLLSCRQADIWTQRMANGERYPIQSAELIRSQLVGGHEKDAPR